MPAQDSAASINLLVSNTETPPRKTLPSRPQVSSIVTANRDRPKPIKIPISLSAYVPGHASSKPQRRLPVAQRRPASSLTQTTSLSKSNPVKMCHVGSTQGMCVKNDLVQTLCIPLGFKAVQKDCTANFMCCYNAGLMGDDSSGGSNSVDDTGAGQDMATSKPAFIR